MILHLGYTEKRKEKEKSKKISQVTEVTAKQFVTLDTKDKGSCQYKSEVKKKKKRFNSQWV